MKPSTCSLVAVAALALPAAARAQELTREDVKRLLPRAIGMSADDWHAITNEPKPPTIRSFRELRLTSLFLLSRWAPDRREDAAFRFLRDVLPSPAQLAPSLQRSLPDGFVSFVQADDLREIEIFNPVGPEADGTCSFELEGFYRGTLHFTARRGDGPGWEIVAVELPGQGIRSHLRDGKWVGAEALLGGQWVRKELGLAFGRLAVGRQEFESWKRPGARPVLTELADQRPGAAIVARPERPATSWRFLGATVDGRPSLDAVERLIEARARTGFATLVAPGDVTRVLFDDPRGAPHPPIVTEVLPPGIGRASGTFELRVEGFMEGEGRFEARYVSPAHLPEWFEGAWVLQRVDLPGLGWVFERAEDLDTWRASPLR